MQVLALQRRLLLSSDPSNYAATNTDSDVESLPFDGPPYGFENPQTEIFNHWSMDVETVDQATSPRPADDPPKPAATDMTSQTSLHFDHIFTQTEAASLKDAEISAGEAKFFIFSSPKKKSCTFRSINGASGSADGHNHSINYGKFGHSETGIIISTCPILVYSILQKCANNTQN